MSDTYKVRMTVLALMKADYSHRAADDAADLATQAGLTVLHVDEPEKVVAPIVYRDQEDIYP